MGAQDNPRIATTTPNGAAPETDRSSRTGGLEGEAALRLPPSQGSRLPHPRRRLFSSSDSLRQTESSHRSTQLLIAPGSQADSDIARKETPHDSEALTVSVGALIRHYTPPSLGSLYWQGVHLTYSRRQLSDRDPRRRLLPRITLAHTWAPSAHHTAVGCLLHLTGSFMTVMERGSLAAKPSTPATRTE